MNQSSPLPKVSTQRRRGPKARSGNPQLERVLRAGAMLATCAFNLKQRYEIHDRDREVLGERQKEWDAAVMEWRRANG